MLLKFSDWLIYGILGLTTESHMGATLNFFIYDSIEIIVLFYVTLFKQVRDGIKAKIEEVFKDLVKRGGPFFLAQARLMRYTAWQMNKPCKRLCSLFEAKFAENTPGRIK